MAQERLRRRRRTKIIATIGPASSTPEVLARLFRGGADVFRLKLQPRQPRRPRGQHRPYPRAGGADRAPDRHPGRRAGPEAARGPASRPGASPCRPARPSGWTCRPFPATPPTRRVQLPHPEIMVAAGIGTTPVAGRWQAAPCGWSTSATTTWNARSSPAAPLSDRKGVNVPDVVLPIPALTKKDHEDLRFALDHGVDYIGPVIRPTAGGRGGGEGHRRRACLDHDQAGEAAGARQPRRHPGAVRLRDGGPRRPGRGTAARGGPARPEAHRAGRPATRHPRSWWPRRCWRA